MGDACTGLVVVGMSDEKRAFRRTAKRAAFEAGKPLYVWLKLNGIPRSVYYSENNLTLESIYSLCKATAMKPSEFFASMGK